MLIPSSKQQVHVLLTSLSRRVNANSQPADFTARPVLKLIKKGEC